VSRPGLLVDVADLPRDGIVLLDTRLALTGPTGRERYDAGHLPSAVFVDLETELAEPPGRGGRHPLPTPERFVAAMRRAGVGPRSVVVVYDDGPGLAAARLWWLLRYYGHDSVQVLDGGAAEYARQGGQLTTDATPPPGPTEWTGTPGQLPTVDADGAVAVARDGVLIDVRAAERFRGETEPLDPVAGHIPGAVNAPLAGNTDDRGRLLPPAALRARFEALGSADGPVAAYCGSGVTACQTVLAMTYAGLGAALYPGSWSGWIADPDRPVSTGP
jgi:thiosulfate/3-mercaptopyruvate sulfurtransferase